MAFEADDQSPYIVLKNHEEQYSLWPEAIAIPDGWTPTGFAGTLGECSAHVDDVWADMRPASLRQAMNATG